MLSAEEEMRDLSNRLIVSVTSGDWAAYAELCAADLSCFEPEAVGNRVDGLAFHQHYFPKEPKTPSSTTTLADFRVRMVGSDAAVVTYTRLTQSLDASGSHQTIAYNETRVWHKSEAGGWKHVHFHRSPAGRWGVGT
jgi:calcium/calmodulin-dependent protein kinase (CaM kinase) II